MGALDCNTTGTDKVGVGYTLGKRVIDVVAASATLLMLVLPLLASVGIKGLRRVTGVPGGSLAFLAERIFKASHTALELLAGRVTLVGPRRLTQTEAAVLPAEHANRRHATPGLVCTWWLRCRSNIDFGTELEADLEYLQTRSLRGDLALLLRCAIALAYGRREEACQAGHRIGGIRLVNIAMEDLLNAMMVALHRRQPTRLAFVNPDCVNIAASNAEYRQSLASADWVCADGIGMKIAGTLLDRPVRQNLNGTDLFPQLCEQLAASGHSVYFLGAAPGIAERASQWALERNPRLRVAGTRSGYFTESGEAGVIEAIRASGADVLLVAMGAARQEPWLERHLPATGATIGIGVGGLFDFYSGRIPRAPLWLREIGGEWIYRLIQEPGRMWRRYLLGNGIFLVRILKERFTHNNEQGVPQ